MGIFLFEFYVSKFTFKLKYGVESGKKKEKRYRKEKRVGVETNRRESRH